VSSTGATYTPIYTFPSPLSFNGKTNITLTSIIPAGMEFQTFNYIRVVASWGGNRYTYPGVASNTIERIR
jgi:hypothetical protein